MSSLFVFSGKERSSYGKHHYRKRYPQPSQLFDTLGKPGTVPLEEGKATGNVTHFNTSRSKRLYFFADVIKIFF